MVGDDAQGQGRGCGCGEGDGCWDSDPAGGLEGGVFLDWPRVERCQQTQIVEAGHARVGQADDGQPDVPVVDGSGEGIELTEEAAGEGDSDEREQEEP